MTADEHRRIEARNRLIRARQLWEEVDSTGRQDRREDFDPKTGVFDFPLAAFEEKRFPRRKK